MKTSLLDSPAKRVPIALAVLTLIVLASAGAWFFLDTPPSEPLNGQKILSAAHAYTLALTRNHTAVPTSVPLQTLIDQRLLQPADLGSLQGMDAKIYLTVAGTNKYHPLMSVHMPDGSQVVLWADGSSQRVKPKP